MNRFFMIFTKSAFCTGFALVVGLLSSCAGLRLGLAELPFFSAGGLSDVRPRSAIVFHGVITEMNATTCIIVADNVEVHINEYNEDVFSKLTVGDTLVVRGIYCGTRNGRPVIKNAGRGLDDLMKYDEAQRRMKEASHVAE